MTGARLVFLVSLFLLGACFPERKEEINGYVEGEYVYVSATSGGLLKVLSVQKGDRVKRGDPLFSLDLEKLQAALLDSMAQVKQAESTLLDLQKGRRPEDIAVIVKQKDQAEAALKDARKEYDRALELIKRDNISYSILDKRESTYKSAKGRVDELDADLRKAKIGAREDEIEAARQAVLSSVQRMKQAEKTLKEAHPESQVEGSVENTYFRISEYVGAGVPVLSILPPENVKIRFFIPQKKLPEFTVGRAVFVSCDGCDGEIPAKVTFVSSKSEFTPPVIYSVESRQKLVFMVEAKPDAFTAQLHPGLPVSLKIRQP